MAAGGAGKARQIVIRYRPILAISDRVRHI
jgi:hypothetical protein